MALTPEDVLNKNFTATQFRRGYDEQEVDDFLDEVVVELRRLLGENAELRRKLATGQGGGLTVAGGQASSVPVGADEAGVRDAEAATKSQLQRIQKEAEDRIAKAWAGAEQAEKEAADRIARARADAEAAEQQAAEQQAAEQVLVAVPAGPETAAGGAPIEAQSARGAVESTPANGVADAAGVIALAQKLHDEYVSQGKAEHDRLLNDASGQREAVLAEATGRRDQMLAEAGEQRDRLVGEAQARHEELISSAEARHAELVGSAQREHDRLLAEAEQIHERLISEAHERSTGMVADATQNRQRIVAELEGTRSDLTHRIAELHEFERAYRGKLRSFIEGQLAALPTAEIVARHEAGGEARRDVQGSGEGGPPEPGRADDRPEG